MTDFMPNEISLWNWDNISVERRDEKKMSEFYDILTFKSLQIIKIPTFYIISLTEEPENLLQVVFLIPGSVFESRFPVIALFPDF